MSASETDSALYKTQTTVAVLPLGKVDEAELRLIESVLRGFFNLQTKRLPAVNTPNDSYDLIRNQHDAYLLVDFVLSCKPKDADRIIGVLNQSIFHKTDTGKMIFGMAAESQGVALYSIKDLHKYPITQWFRRAKIRQRRSRWIILHEMGHVLGCRHCGFRSCVMFQYFNVQTDYSDPEYCSDHLRQISAKISDILVPQKK